ncbi:retropepsin-like aspartic protease, partial [Serratia marcescens]|nr:retropepsin-like aspartic protease family protein [Serratia marcescens]
MALPSLGRQPPLPENPPQQGQDQGLREQIEAIVRQLNGHQTTVEREYSSASPFTARVLNHRPHRTFKNQCNRIYKGDSDPLTHIRAYKDANASRHPSDESLCIGFATTLDGEAREWYDHLRPGTIDSFEDLANGMILAFRGHRRMRHTAQGLSSIVQKKTETTSAFWQRFSNYSVSIPDLTGQQLKSHLVSNTRSQLLATRLTGLIDPTLNLVKQVVGEVLFQEEGLLNGGHQPPVSVGKRPHHEDGTEGKSNPSKGDAKKQKGNGRQNHPENRRNDQRRNDRGNRPDGPRAEVYTALTAPREVILNEIKDKEYLRWPRPMGPKARRNESKYCKYHRDRGHDTEDCWDLKREIENLIQRGRLSDYVQGGNKQKAAPVDQQPNAVGIVHPTAASSSAQAEMHAELNGPAVRDIHTITGGLAAGGKSSADLKKYAEEACERDPNMQRPRDQGCVISFCDDDLVGLYTPHDDALVIQARVKDSNVFRIMVDTGSAADVLFFSCFQQMKLEESELVPGHNLVGFSGNSVKAKGMITLPMLVGDFPPCQRMISVAFTVMDCPSTYNIILGRPSLKSLQAVASTYHLAMKFPTPRGV